MKTVHFRNLRNHALRGVDSIRPGRKMLLVHVGDWSSFATEIVPLTGLIELTGTELDRIRGFRLHVAENANNKYLVFLHRDSEGCLDYRHAADSGLIPYNEGTDREFVNKSNFMLDKKALKKIGIKVTK